MMRALGLALLAVLVAAPVYGQPYRWVDEQGGVHYADRPPHPAPPGLETLNPAARRRQPPGAAAPAPPEPAPAPVAMPTHRTPTLPTARPPVVEAKPEQASSAPGPPAREVRGPDNRDVVREIMDLAGIDRYVDSLARGAQGDLARLAWSTREPDAAWEALVPVVRRDVLAAATAAALARRLAGESEHLAVLLAWLRSSEHSRIRQAEIEAAKPASHSPYRRFVTSLVENNVKLPHLSLIQQLERAGPGADRHLALERSLRQAMQRAVAPLALRAVNDGEDDTDAQAAERARFWRVTRSLFAYRGLGSSQIEAAVRFERSPAGVWFTRIAWESLEEAIVEVEQRATRAITSVATRSLPRP
jgi:hypothetical protein